MSSVGVGLVQATAQGWTLVVALLATAAVPAQTSRVPTSASSKVPARTADPVQCRAGGGTIQRRGLLGSSMCVVAFKDAGKPCRGKTDCGGKCLAAPGQADVTRPRGSPAKGICQAENTPFGCYAEVEGGKLATPFLCTD